MRTSRGLISIAAIVACSSLGSLASASCPSSTPYGCVESYASYVYPWPGGKTYCRRWKPGSFKLVGIHGAPIGFSTSQLSDAFVRSWNNWYNAHTALPVQASGQDTNQCSVQVISHEDMARDIEGGVLLVHHTKSTRMRRVPHARARPPCPERSSVRVGGRPGRRPMFVAVPPVAPPRSPGPRDRQSPRLVVARRATTRCARVLPGVLPCDTSRSHARAPGPAFPLPQASVGL